MRAEPGEDAISLSFIPVALAYFFLRSFIWAPSEPVIPASDVRNQDGSKVMLTELEHGAAWTRHYGSLRKREASHSSSKW